MNQRYTIAHILRKYDPKEWAGTETALKDLLTALDGDMNFEVFCPKISSSLLPQVSGPLEKTNAAINRFNSFLPLLGLSDERKQQLTQIGGNLMSFDLLKTLWKDESVQLIHLHTLGLIGAVGRTVARQKNIPLVVSLHGGVIDIPKEFLDDLKRKMEGTLSYSRIFNLVLRPNSTLQDADAIITFNNTEERLLLEKYPDKNIINIPHGIDISSYKDDYSDQARSQYPQFKGKTLCLVVARIDPVKNQLWLIEQIPEILKICPDFVLGILGPVTDESYLNRITKKISDLGVDNHVSILEPISPNDQKLVGLFQLAKMTVLPSIAEPFGLVILESWAANTPVLANKTSGPQDIITHRETGWLFDVDQPETFHSAFQEVITNESMVSEVVKKSHKTLTEKYDKKKMSGKVKSLYGALIESKAREQRK